MVTQTIAEFIANTGYEKIPEKAITIAKMCILDGFGVALAGCHTSTGKIITKYVEDIGGKPESGVIGGGFKTSSQSAALANGTLAHSLDYDDQGITWIGHPTVVLFPPIFALADKENLAGRQILESYAVGWEVGSKLGKELSAKLFDQGWHPTPIIGTLAATSACAKLLRLTTNKIKIALGIAASGAAGMRCNFGTDTKPLHAGTAGSNAIRAVMLAQMGFTGNDSLFEDTMGFCQIFAKKQCDLDVFKALGSPFDIITSYSIKPYPSCGLIHRCIDAMLYLLEEYKIHPDHVAEVECHIPTTLREILINSPPKTGLQGKFSLQYCMAACLIDNEVSLRQFTDEKVQSPIAQHLISKVKLCYLENLEGKSLLEAPQAVKVKLQNGTEYFKEVQWSKGYSYNPMSWNEIAEKFRDCAAGVLSPKEINQAINLLSKIESLASISEIIAVVCKT